MQEIGKTKLTDRVVIVGQGYVGLPLARAASNSGLKVTGLELDPARVQNLNAGISHVDDIDHDGLRLMLEKGYSATTDPCVIAGADVVVICVPTPLDDSGRPDLRPVTSAAETIAAYMTDNTLVVLESTTYPGTTNELVLPILERSGLVFDVDFFLAFSPERIDPGNPDFGLKNTPKVVGGASDESAQRTINFYKKFVDTVVPVKGTREAETAKLLENTYRHVNIALVNEMARFCHDLKIDLWDVIRAASTKPFGFQAFYPGPGVGGHCIPIDPNYLSYEVQRALGYPFRFVELAQEINNSMPRYIVDRVQDVLNDVQKPLNKARILLLGVTYKPNITDQRESPATAVAEILQAKGALVEFHDPRVDHWVVGKQEHSRIANLEESIRTSDIVVLLQNHREYDVDGISEMADLFFDSRGASTSRKAVRL